VREAVLPGSPTLGDSDDLVRKGGTTMLAKIRARRAARQLSAVYMWRPSP